MDTAHAPAQSDQGRAEQSSAVREERASRQPNQHKAKAWRLQTRPRLRTTRGGSDANPHSPSLGWLGGSGSPLAFESSAVRRVPEQQAPMVPFSRVPCPSPPRPWACPLPAFPGRYKYGAGNHNICCPGDGCQGKGLRWARSALAQRGRQTHAPASASPALRTQQDHGLITQEKLRPREARALLRGSQTQNQNLGPVLRLPGLLLFPGKEALPVSP